ncbi:MAG: tyrosine protein phosphatase, partial [Aurantimonas coralicida]
MSYLVVSSLAELPATVASHGAQDLVTLINADTRVDRPSGIAPDRHLFLGFNDIAEPIEGLTAPTVDHLDQLL